MSSQVAVEALRPAFVAIGEAIEREHCPGKRAAAIALALRTVWPKANLAACMLREGPSHRVAALDAAGMSPTDWNDATKLPATASTEAMVWRGHEYGRLIVAAPGDGVAPLLTVIARATAAQLAADEFDADSNADATRIDVGELAGPLIHDVTNLLNNLVLNLAVLEQGGDLSMFNVPRLRSRSEQVAALIKEVQDYQRQATPANNPCDLNAAARDAVAMMKRDLGRALGTEPVVALALSDDLPVTRASRPDLVRCLAFLLRGAGRAAHVAGKPMKLSTMAAANAALVRVELPGVHVLVESQPRLFDTLGAVCPGISSLELATCKSIARRFNGRLSADCPAEIGLVLQVELPAN
jgi:hypothetical protein